MNRTLSAAIAATAAALTLAGCSSSPEPTTPSTVTVTAAATAPTTAPATVATEATGRTPGQPVQEGIFLRALNAANANMGDAPVDKARALDFGASMCDALDAGASTFDANQILVEGGMTPTDAGKVAATGIAAVCSEHLP